MQNTYACQGHAFARPIFLLYTLYKPASRQNTEILLDQKAIINLTS